MPSGFLTYSGGSGCLRRSSHRGPAIVDFRIFSYAYRSRLNECERDGNFYYAWDYKSFATTVRKMVQALRERHIEPIVIMPGCSLHPDDEDKYTRQMQEIVSEVNGIVNVFDDTSMAAMFQSRIPVLLFPLLAQTLKHLRVELLQADRDLRKTSVTITKVANQRQCPILTADTNLLMHPIDSGLLWINSRGASGIEALYKADKTFVVQSWKSRDFCQNKGISQEDLTLLYASALSMYEGRAFRNYAAMIEDIVTSNDRNEKIDRLFDRGTHPEKDKRAFIELTESLREALDADGNENEYLLSSECMLQAKSNSRRVPAPYQEQWRKCRFAPYLMDVLCDGRVYLPIIPQNPSRDSVYECSSVIRDFSYGVIRNFTATPTKEFAQNGDRYEPTIRDGLNFQIPSLDEIPGMDIDARKRLFFRALNLAEFEVPGILHIPDNSKQFKECITRFWARNCCSTAWLYSAVKYWEEDLDEQGRDREINRMDEETRPGYGGTRGQGRSLSSDERKRALHELAQYQVIFLDAYQLNQLLLEPFGDPPITLQASFCLGQQLQVS